MIVRICTWEYVTTFDGQPFESQIVKRFEQDFPQVDTKHVFLNPMVSFNSAEGRKIRFLVMIVDEFVVKKNMLSGALRPSQIWMFGWVDEYLRHNSTGSGNGLFWKIEDSRLFILVFLEGRLCHWSEENGYDGSVDEIENLLEQRLSRFRIFLKKDDLFSRGGDFPEVEIEGAYRKSFFRRAARDSFWKQVDLRKQERRLLPAQKNRFKANGAIVLAAALFVTLLWAGKSFVPVEDESLSMRLQDAPLIELLAPPLYESTEEKAPVHAAVRRKNSCFLSPLRLRGIVAPRMFVAEMESSEMQTFKAGDSLGNFVVSEIQRTFVSLTCKDSVLLISVE
ncbi:MAG: hypothetical protein MJY85_09845 [Fibrobacter sp.]|nr:hypothetical protein [Fibrobacter sp.]